MAILGVDVGGTFTDAVRLMSGELIDYLSGGIVAWVAPDQ